MEEQISIKGPDHLEFIQRSCDEEIMPYARNRKGGELDCVDDSFHYPYEYS
jgi:hypothetical protein